MNRTGKFFAGIFQGLLSTLILFVILEGLCFVAGLPEGASRFTETVILRNNLKVKKTPGEFRIFTYGESTMHGSHYWPASSPARWLDEYLKDFLPGRRIRIVNFARMGKNVGFIYHSFKETLPYKPDLVIFYLGHNVFLPDERAGNVLKEESELSNKIEAWAQKSRFISAVYRVIIASRMRYKEQKGEDRIEQEVIETPPAGVHFAESVFIPRTSSEYAQNVAFFREGLQKIIRLAEKRKIPALFFRPASNLKDFSPVGSVHKDGLSGAAKKDWETFYNEGKEKQAAGDRLQALEAYQKAYRLDFFYAELSYRMGEIYFKNGELTKARAYFEEARDNDAMPVRATRDILKIYDDMAREKKIRLIPTEKLLSPEVPGGILGEPMVEDNVHFSVKGHSILGRALAAEIAAQGWIAPPSEWKFENERSFEEISRRIGVNDELLYSAFLKCASYFGSRYDMRLIYAQKAASIRPDDLTAMRQLAWTYWLRSEKGKAIETYKKIKVKSPTILREIFKLHPEIQKTFQEMTAAVPA